MPKQSKLRVSPQRVAIVTGSGEGIGRAVAIALAQAGYEIVLIARRVSLLHQTAESIRGLGREAIVIPADVTSERAVVLARDATLKRFGRVDTLINNAATQGPTLPVERIPLDAWNKTIAVNLTGPFLCSKAFARPLVNSKNGSIVNISSVAALRGVALRGPYCASKQGLIGLTRALAKELGPRGVRVNAVCPGPVPTKAVEEVVRARSMQLGVPYRELLERTMRSSSLSRPVRLEEVVAAVVFLASDASSGITGQVLTVAGGD